MSSQKNRIALITGASRGIGRAVAIAMAKKGAHILLLGRTQKSLEEVYDVITQSGGEATGIPLDITDYEAVDKLAHIINERWGRLDILIGNAGQLGPITPVAHIKLKNFEEIIAVNLTANAQLIRIFEPLLLQSKAGRAIFVTSGVVQTIKPFWGLYTASKAALDALVLTWAHEKEKTPLRINLLSPGAIRTVMRAQAMPGEDPTILPTTEDIAPLFVKLADPNYQETGKIIRWQKKQNQIDKKSH